MFDSMGGFNQAFGPPGVQTPPLRQRKTAWEMSTFVVANLLVLPLIAVCYLVVSAHGLREMMGVFATRLYKLPIPGAGMMKNFDGWDRLDLAIVMACLLFVSITYLWQRLFKELMGGGKWVTSRATNPVLFYLLVSICGVILLGDASLFYYGLAAKTSGGWGETPAFVPALATILYMAGLAGVGAWHADFHSSGTV
jgi:hypothetical protein